MMKRDVPQIFSPRRLAARTRRHARRAGADRKAQFLWRHLAEDLLDRLDFIRFEPDEALVLGDHAQALGPALAAKGARVAAPDPLQIDPERPLPFSKLSLIAVLGVLDTVNDVPGALIHARRALKPSGLFIASFPAAGSLAALRELLLAAEPERPAARLHPQIDSRAASGLMQRAGFARQVVDTHRLELRYSSLDRLLADLREQGLGNALANAPPMLTRAALERARAAFDARRESDGKVTERIEFVTLTGWG